MAVGQMSTLAPNMGLAVDTTTQAIRSMLRCMMPDYDPALVERALQAVADRWYDGISEMVPPTLVTLVLEACGYSDLQQQLERQEDITAKLLDENAHLLAIAEAASVFRGVCANFPEGSPYNCYREPDDGWHVTLEPCVSCALDRWHEYERSGE